MVVGFFPISFSLIIALESFVGEKERNSIEPILSMPVSDLELYLGKMLSSLILPLFASYLGITVFLVMRLTTTPPWIPPLDLTILMFLLTTVEALVMVSGAVVVSSQTTSVRAANLLASFIIIPMALLIQAESVIMFYAEYHALWWFVAGLLVVNLILVRMGVRIFNREEILSKELDELSFKKIWRDFIGYFLRPPELAARRFDRESARFDLTRYTAPPETAGASFYSSYDYQCDRRNPGSRSGPPIPDSLTSLSLARDFREYLCRDRENSAFA